MNIAEVVEQARQLSVQERRELISLLTKSIVQETQGLELKTPSFREIVSAKLKAAGRLSHATIPPHLTRVDDPSPFVLPPDARSSDDILNEDRAER